ncbi:MAG: MazG nucleotide pyrophosphohydrolase domain-containing protein [Candidatus Altiarchaeota archaeon]
MALNELQKQVADYDAKSGWAKDKPSHILLHLMEEIGEVSRHVTRHEGYKKEDFEKEELAQELTDVLYLTFKFANSFNVVLDDEWETMWERFKGKTSRG